MGIALLIFWFLALATGSVHPLGLVAAAAFFAASLAFTSSLGTYISLRSQSTMRALGVTLAPLIVLNGGFMLCCLTPFSPNNSGDFASSAIPFRLAYNAPISYHEAGWLFDPAQDDQTVAWQGGYYGNNAWNDYPWRRQELRWSLLFYAISVPVYAVAAFLFAWFADRRFAVAADRPRLPGMEADLEEDEPRPARNLKPAASEA